MKSICTFLKKGSLLLLLLLIVYQVKSQTLKVVKDEVTLNRNLTADLYPFGNKLFFVIDDDNTGAEPWISDSTPAGTFLLKDIVPGDDDLSNLGRLAKTVYKNEVYFSGGTQVPLGDGTILYSTDLYKTNGTPEGTVRVLDFSTRTTVSTPSISTMVVSGNTLFFVFQYGTTTVSKLWITDGTAEGTKPLKDINPGASDEIKNVIDVNGTLFFTAVDAEHGQELWKSDGTEAGTVMVKEIAPSTSSTSYPYTFFAAGSTLYFPVNDETHGTELWKTDGTSEGTVMIKDINPNGSGIVGNGFLGEVDGVMYFWANDVVNGSELWRTDGTEQGTHMVKDINTAGSSSPLYFARVGNKFIFVATDGSSVGRELWVSDGTEAGTYLLKDFNPSGSTTFTAGSFNSIGDVAFFIRRNPTTLIYELWKTDGTAEGTVQINAENDVDVRSYVIANKTLFAKAVNIEEGLTMLYSAYFGAKRLSQTITFPALPKKAVGQADFDPHATASSGLPITYLSDNDDVATIVDGKIHLVGEGTVTITALQSGSDMYAPAEAVTQTLTVYPEGTKFGVISLSNDLVFGDVISGLSMQQEFTITNTGDSPLSVTGITFPEGYTGIPTEKVLEPEESFSVMVTFSPTQPIDYTGEITVLSDATDGDNTLEVSGTGVLITGFEEDPNLSVTVYPNPSAGLYSLKARGLELPDLSLIDELGRAQRVTLTQNSSDSYLLDIRHLPAGVYILRLPLNHTLVAKRLIKIH